MKTTDSGLRGQPASTLIVDSSVQPGIFVRTGEFWRIRYDEVNCTLKNTLGLSYLQRLLQHPGKEFHAVDLLMGPRTSQSEGELVKELLNEGFIPRRQNEIDPVLDARGAQEFRRRLRDLAEQLEEVRAKGALERADQIEEEIDSITQELKRLLYRNRSRSHGSEAERARINVTRAIRAAIQRVGEHHGALGSLLDKSIRTGTFCSYLPKSRIDWKFASDKGDSFAETPAQLIPPAPRTPVPASAPELSLAPQDQTGLVGRTAERELIGASLRRAMNGANGIVMISGPAGIGKTWLARAIGDDARRLGFLTRAGNCYDREDSVPYVAIVEAFETALAHAPTPASFCADLGDEAVEIARLMPQLRQLFPDLPPPLQGTPEQVRRALFNAIVAVTARQSARTPMLLILEDIHWADEGTLALIAHFVRALADSRIMLMLTYRDETIDPASQFGQTLDDLLRFQVEHVPLRGLPQTAVSEMVEALGGGGMSRYLLDAIYSYTEGNPLFVQELVRHLSNNQPRGVSLEAAARNEIDLPHSLRLVIGRRLARVSQETQKMLGTAAVIGRSFTFALLEAATGIEADRLLDLVEEAEKAGLISSRLRYPDAQFKFAHELIRRATLDDLSVARRQRLHLSVAEAIEQLHPNALEDEAEDLAHHLWNAGAAAEAGKTIRYLQIAGAKAVQTAANVEAINHFKKALRLVNSAPDSPERAQTELMLQVALAVPLATTRGYASPELEGVFARARLLTPQAGDAPQLFPVLWLLWLFHTARAEHIIARDLAGQCLRLAEKAGDPVLLLAAHHALGVSLSTLADFGPALEHLKQTIKLYDPEQHAPLAFQFGQDFGVVARSHAAIDLWYLGYPERALRMTEDAVNLARKLAHPLSLAAALTQTAWVHWMARDVPATRELAEKALKLAGEGDLGYWMPVAQILRGWALAQGVDSREGIARMRDGLAAYRATGAGVLRPAFLAALADAYDRAEQPEQGLDALREAYGVVQQSGERWWEPELYRLEGELTLKLAKTETPSAAHRKKAGECFQRAIEIAHEQKAKLLELRAMVSLSRLGAMQNKRLNASPALKEVHGWFTEGFDTPDLLGAAQLLARHN